MTEQEQRIALAEELGWERHTLAGGQTGWIHPKCREMFRYEHELPDCLHDWNATAAAKRALLNTVELQDRYACILGALTGGKCIDYGAKRVDVTTKILFASAAQETEAIIRAIGKWKD